VLRSDDEDVEGYEEDDYGEPRRRGRSSRERALAALRAPATCLLVAGILGLLINGYFLLSFLVATEADVRRGMGNVNPQQAETARHVVQFITGPGGISIMAFFVFLSIIVILGAIMMLIGKMRWLAVIGSVFAMLNPGCCCIFGMPFGIWSLVVLLRPESQSAFQ
jgi:hypothetical protein